MCSTSATFCMQRKSEKNPKACQQKIAIRPSTFGCQPNWQQLVQAGELLADKAGCLNDWDIGTWEVHKACTRNFLRRVVPTQNHLASQLTFLTDHIRATYQFSYHHHWNKMLSATFYITLLFVAFGEWPLLFLSAISGRSTRLSRYLCWLMYKSF